MSWSEIKAMLDFTEKELSNMKIRLVTNSRVLALNHTFYHKKLLTIAHGLILCIFYIKTGLHELVR